MDSGICSEVLSSPTVFSLFLSSGVFNLINEYHYYLLKSMCFINRTDSEALVEEESNLILNYPLLRLSQGNPTHMHLLRDKFDCLEKQRLIIKLTADYQDGV